MRRGPASARSPPSWAKDRWWARPTTMRLLYGVCALDAGTFSTSALWRVVGSGCLRERIELPNEDDGCQPCKGFDVDFGQR